MEPLTIFTWGLILACLLPLLPKLLATLSSLVTHLPRSPGQSPTLPSPSLLFEEKLPFISVHIATYDEPADLVIETLRSFLHLDYPRDRYEVILLDNNTPDPTVWRPVQKWCAAQDSRFHFYHYDDVQGAKAGALNLALHHTSEKATLIASVDADYRVDPDFLRSGAAVFSDSTLTHAQFPQCYRNRSERNSGIAAELHQYFTTYATQAGRSGKMLLTGTLSLIRREALIRAGGWPTTTITEDAELGVKLLEQGGRGIYLDQVAGKGLMPGDLSALSVQRTRWAAGNVQVLRDHLQQILRGQSDSALTPSAVLQLSAWPSLVLLLAAPFFTLLLMDRSPTGLTLFATALNLGIILEITVASITAAGSFRERVEAGLVRLALLPESVLGTLNGLFATQLRFVRTPKGSSAERSGNGLALCVVLAALIYLFTQAIPHGLPVTSALALLASIPFLRLWLDHSLREAPFDGSAEASLPLPLPKAY